eukprot:COSAG02_NODE_23107_length_730_cov_0.884311_1_plen_197_part_10
MGSRKAAAHTAALIDIIGDHNEYIAMNALSVLDTIGIDAIFVALKRDDGQSPPKVDLTRLRERTRAKLLAEDNGSAIFPRARKMDQTTMPDEILWQKQMHEQAKAGNLNVRDLCNIGSLPTLLKLHNINSLQRDVYSCISSIAVAAGSALPTVSWTVLLHPLLGALNEPVPACELHNCLHDVLDWADRVDGITPMEI